MNVPAESAVVYALGFVGLASFGLIPCRSWALLSNITRGQVSRRRKHTVLMIAVLVIAASVWCGVVIAMRLFVCLTEPYCGPGVASGWGYLAMLGAVYMAFEAAGYSLRKGSR